MKFKREKVKSIAPESRIQGANIHVEAQQEQFRKMIDEVHYARCERLEAIEELRKERNSLQAQLARKENEINKAVCHNEADAGFINKLKDLIGE